MPDSCGDPVADHNTTRERPTVRLSKLSGSHCPPKRGEPHTGPGKQHSLPGLFCNKTRDEGGGFPASETPTGCRLAFAIFHLAIRNNRYVVYRGISGICMGG